MEQSQLDHVVIGVRPENLQFYKELMSFLGWTTILEGHGMLGVGGKNGAKLWFGGNVKDMANDYDGPGMNHIGIATATRADVDATVAYLQARGIPPLFETPRDRPDFTGDSDRSYYQVMFESPDRVLFEVVYTGPKSA